MNMFFIILMLVFIFIEMLEDSKFVDHTDSYLTIAHNSFCFIISLILFFLGFTIKNMIRKSITDVNSVRIDNEDFSFARESSKIKKVKSNESLHPANGKMKKVNSSESLQAMPKKIKKVSSFESLHSLSSQIRESKNDITNPSENYYNLMGELNETNIPNYVGEIYFKIRIAQINFVTLSFFLCDSYELVFCLGVKFFSENNFSINGYRTLPLTHEASVFYFLHLFCIILPIFTNFMAFYFLIRKSYKSEIKRRSKCNFSEADITEYAPKSTKDIEQYLN